MRWFSRLLLFGFLFSMLSVSVLALGVAPSSLNIDYVSGEVISKNMLVVNTLDVPVLVEVGVSEWANFISFPEFEGSVLELEVGEQYSLNILFDFSLDVDFFSDEVILTFIEGSLGDSMVGSSVTLNVPVKINGVVVSEESAQEFQEVISEETSFDDSEVSDLASGDGSEESVQEAQVRNEESGSEELNSNLVGNDLEEISFSGENTNSGKLFFAAVLLILFVLFGHMLYRYLHPEHDF